MSGAQARRVILYTRPGCHLCEEAEDLLAALSTEISLQIETIDILSDPAIYEQYKWIIPVIAVEGGATLSAPIGERALRAALGCPANDC